MTVLMRNGAPADKGDNLHITVRMRRKAAPGLNDIIIDNQQPAKAQAFRVIIIGKAEVKIRVQSAVIGIPKVFIINRFNHFIKLHHLWMKAISPVADSAEIG